MRVLYVAHYREDSGWGEAARNYILALDKVGVDVVCRPIIFDNKAELPDRIKELEAKAGGNFDVCIQNVLPHLMEWNSSYKKNIGQFVTETRGIEHTSWFPKLKLMDELWVANNAMNFEFSNLKKTHTIPHCFDLSIYDKTYEKLDLPDIEGKYVFYFIGEFNRRKNIGGILRAFHTVFDRNDNVALVLKLNKPGMSGDQLGHEFDRYTNTIKTELHLHKNISHYIPEIVIPFRIGREEILRLHSTCDCFVSLSMGEAWNIPMFEACAMNKRVISSNTDGFSQYQCVGCFVIDGTEQPLIGAEQTFPGFGTAREKWTVSDINIAGEYMRTSYDCKDYPIQNDMSAFSYESVGQKMLEALNA